MKRVSATTASNARIRNRFVRKFKRFGLLEVFDCVSGEGWVCSGSSEETREECAEVFLAVFCALFDFLVEAFLFAFFDSDTVDFHSWSIHVTRVARRDGHEDVQTLYNLSEDSVPVIQVRRGAMGDKELTAIRARPGVCHRENT